MGVPSFFRWLVNKYPKVVVAAVEGKNDHDQFVDPATANPNNIEFDNFYLDMNGIIHPCFHPEEEDDDDDCAGPRSYEDVFNNIFEYIDRLFRIVRPRKLLYMAIDGVAPRAKMNQQRTRRFKSAMDKDFSETEENKLRRQFENAGKHVLQKVDSEVSDSNIITPGTDFMYKLSHALRGYIKLRLSTDSGWRDIKVILSDSNVPGEGEHKVMSFIRHQRNLDSYDPNTRHCLYGLDADLIMLALATHEVHFSIIREDLLQADQQQHANCQSSASSSAKSKAHVMKKPYQFLHVWILREYLELDMHFNNPPENFKFDIERIIDDFIFMCFFAGNDFLPHMPTLEIHEGAIDLLMSVYKNEFKNLGGYLVDMLRVEEKKLGYIKLSRVEKFILLVGLYEEKIFKKRSEIYERKLRRLCFSDDSATEEIDTGSSGLNLEVIKETAVVPVDTASSSQILEDTTEFKKKLKAIIRRKSDMFRNGNLGADKVRLGSPGSKERYYKQKFSAESPGEMETTRKEVVRSYTEGLVWVLLYYFSGPPSWKWFYPFHYGPFASDMKGIAQVRPQFQKGFPFKPLDTLLAVLPPRSAHALPPDYRKLMIEESSSIIDFYPSDFEIDMDGKRFTWQGICKLPFIEEERLVNETTKLEKELVVEEIDRNAVKSDQLFMRSTHNMVSHILPLCTRQSLSINIDASLSGFIRPLHDNFAEGEGRHYCSKEDSVLCALYELPNTGPHKPYLLNGVELPMKTINEGDLMETYLWHESQGNAPARSVQPAQARFRRPDMKNQSLKYNAKFSTSSPSCSIHKFAGSGWGCGRGQANASPDSGYNIYTPKRTSSDQKGASSSSSYARECTSDYREGALQCGFKDLKIPEADQCWRPSGRGVQLNNGYWPSRNAAPQARNYSPQGSQSTYPNQSRGRGAQQDSWQHTSKPAGTGRGIQFSWTHSRSPFAANRSSTPASGARRHFVPHSVSESQNGKW